jgi:glycosyltransferase involved in cell wall biosynthesis
MIWPTPAANPVRISLILPVYNVAKYLLECLQSVIDQSFAVSIWSKFGVSW